jgi:hypothetical protein
MFVGFVLKGIGMYILANCAKQKVKEFIKEVVDENDKSKRL